MPRDARDISGADVRTLVDAASGASRPTGDTVAVPNTGVAEKADATPPSSIVFEVPGVGTVEMAPAGGSTALAVARILGADSVNPLLNAYVRALCYVRSINGERVPRPNTWAEAQILGNRLGDAGVELATQALAQYWPAVSLDALSVLKK